MANIYISYKCKKCRKEFVLLVADVEDNEKSNKYLTCPYCGSGKLVKQKITDNLKECMAQNFYKREHGAIHQINY